MRHLIHRLGLFTLAAMVSLSGCDKSPPDRSGHPPSPKTSALHKAPVNPNTEARQTIFNHRLQHKTDEPVWLSTEFEDPDPTVRLQAIEAWARKPGETLDPLTYALVDPDEKVRARAQELLEEELARR